MNIVVCCKFTPNTQDIETRPDGSISLDKAEWQISEYDLQAIEAGVRLSEATGGKLIALSLGSPRIEAARLRKDLLSRGPDELHLITDDTLGNVDTAVVSTVLAETIKKIGADLVLCGEGSADLYFQQTGAQIGERLSWPTLNGIESIEPNGNRLKVERLLESEIEVLDVPLPAVLTVTSSINTPPVPGMKALLSASKKPVKVWSLSELGLDTNLTASIEVISTSAPRTIERKGVIIDGTTEEAVAELVRYLDSEGAL
ncbi:MAG TPA: putative electron transfer flavoprotein FixA [Syntrophomonadaceae bacterium]|nr:putative electron transfer flavoprotein FixA [Syntrophomonadaceae bacterium]